MSDTAAPDDRSARLPGTNSLLWVLWLTYGSFYFCRTNLSAALPGIETEFGFTKTDMGTILGGLKLAYGVGQLIFGPQVLLVGTAPVDLARHDTPAAAVGFVNFMGYMGAFSGGQVTGALVDHHGWQTGIWFWAGCAFGAAGCVAFLWRASPTHRRTPS